MEIIRPSINSHVYFEHAKTTKLAADELLNLFESAMESHPIEENPLKQLGLFRSTLMLYSVTIELLLKSSALHAEREKIKSGEIKKFHDFKKGLKYGHDFMKIITKYQLKFPPEEIELICSLQDYAVWAGRFPYPIDDETTRIMENSNGASGPSLSFKTKTIVESIFERVREIISDF